MKRKQVQRVLIVFFGLAFIGSTGAVIVGSLLRRSDRSELTSDRSGIETASVEEQLQSQARGYTRVLEREPENVTALIGLYRVRRDLGDLEAAKVPLSKLIELYPEEAQFTNELAQLEAVMAAQEQFNITNESDLPD